MSAESIIGLISGTGGVISALVVFLALIIGGVFLTRGAVEKEREQTAAYIKNLEEQIAEKDAAIRIERDRADNERRRADVSVEAAQTANVLLASLTGRREIGAS